MSGLNRRDFLKALGVTGSATALSACGADGNVYLTPIEKVLPYAVRPDQLTPGTPTFFATTVHSGPAARPALARTREGRVINVGANTRAPWAPAVPSTALFELQKHYSPDRLKGPAVAEGATGPATKAITWDEGITKLADAVKAARAGGKKVAYLGGYHSGAITKLIDAFTAGESVYWEPLGYEADVAASEIVFGRRVLADYRIDDAGYVLSFGADFLAGWGAGELGARYGRARNPNHGHSVARFALVSPHRDQTGASADDWYKATPGSQALVARAIAKLIADAKAYQGPALALIGAPDLAAAASASGLSEDDLKAIAGHFAQSNGVALPGGVAAAGQTAVDLAVAVHLINVVAGNIGTKVSLDGYTGPIHAYSRLEQLIADLNAGAVDVLLLDDANPVYALPAATGVGEALAKAKLLVALTSHADESSSAAQLSLPTSDVFEDWGDEEPVAGLRLLRQPSMLPLYDTRGLGDVLIAAGKAAGLGGADPASDPFAAGSWRELLRKNWEAAGFPAEFATFTDFWEKSLENGFALSTVAPAASDVVAASYSWGTDAPAGEGEYFLHVHPHPFRRDGRYANQPWAQEVPDPLTGNVWDSWLEVHPATAEKLGVKRNSLVTVKSANGSFEIGVHVIPTVREDTVALAFGQGRTAGGRYADKVGQNAAALLGAAKSAQGTFAWQQGKVAVTSAGRDAELVTAFSVYGMSDEQRRIGLAVNAAELAKVGDAAAEHPGSLTPIHAAPWDERLTRGVPDANGKSKPINDFYELPDHPVYRFAMTVDTNACNGCGACSVACYAENNLPVVGKDKVREGREMGWIRINRYWETEAGKDDIRFVPMMCQQCGHAGCESVCPVLATYHTIEGLNAMVYNRCVGTRYCSNACPFQVRRFNYHSYQWPEPFNLQLNPEVTTRTMGVMEKCTFCVQRIRTAKAAYRGKEGFNAVLPDAALKQLPACAEACPTQALTFGNLNDAESTPSKTRNSARNYFPLYDLNVFPAINYLGKANFHVEPPHHGGGSHGGAGDHAAPADGHAAPADAGHAEPAGHAAPADAGHAAPAENHAAPAAGEHGAPAAAPAPSEAPAH
jgi:Fe-S-cluster-containing dehydrogenase component/anaerobic selenocysteine-containing dehydrogenase